MHSPRLGHVEAHVALVCLHGRHRVVDDVQVGKTLQHKASLRVLEQVFGVGFQEVRGVTVHAADARRVLGVGVERGVGVHAETVEPDHHADVLVARLGRVLDGLSSRQHGVLFVRVCRIMATLRRKTQR